MARNKVKQKFVIAEEVRLGLQRRVNEFLNILDEYMEFPATLTKEERAYVHEYVRPMGLMSRSYGTGKNRRLMVYKRVMKNNLTQWIALTPESRRLLGRFTGLLTSSETSLKCRGNKRSRNGIFLLPNTSKKLIPLRGNGPRYLTQERLDLPITEHKIEILETIGSNNVIIINGNTGSGKTTQVPQYILENAHEKGLGCRIVCTQPRRMAAVAIAERVAKERGEKLGTTVGFQIRLENCLTKNTNLIYTTSGCVLRSLMNNVNDTFRGLTHIIIDEIHERDKNTDFILITLRDHLKHNKQLKVILMSATMDIGLLSQYFDGVPIINVPGRCFETRTFYLEDILFHTEYKTARMRVYLAEIKRIEEMEKERKIAYVTTLDQETQIYVDGVIDGCYDTGALEESFAQLTYLIQSEGIPVNVAHSVTLKTPLIAAAQINSLEYLVKFANLGADKYMEDKNGMNAMDYAGCFMDRKCFDFLASHRPPSVIEESSERENLLRAYQNQFNDDEEIDHNLLLKLIKSIAAAKYPGSVLVFLPGYNDIIIQKDMIADNLPTNSYKLFLLHSNMKVQDQQQVLAPCPVRKIILSTNIGETSITFPDVTYVIDSGKVKMNAYDSITGTSYLKSIWVSQACAQQRAGRAGRTQTGICYRMYSQDKYESLSKFAIPEFLRIPLTEICLYAKAISRSSPISSYLANALQPPSSVAIFTAVNKLKIIGALDDEENMTDLGLHLVDMPLEVQLGKSLLYSIMMKCLDPVLTVAAFHSVKDPFILPSDRAERGKASFRRKLFSGESFSDHMGIVNMYRQWRAHKSMGSSYERRFCTENYLTKATLDMMHATRQQIFDHIKRTYHLNASNEFNENSDNWSIVQACLVAGMYPNICFIDRARNKITSRLESAVVIHPSSALKPAGCRELRQYINQFNSDWIAFYEKTRTGTWANIRYNTIVSPVIIALFCGAPLRQNNESIQEPQGSNINLDEDDEQEISDTLASAAVATASTKGLIDKSGGGVPVGQWKLIIDDWIEFYICKDDKILIENLKERMNTFMTEFFKHGRVVNKTICDQFLEAIKAVFINEIGVADLKDTYMPNPAEDVMSNIGHFNYLRITN